MEFKSDNNEALSIGIGVKAGAEWDLDCSVRCVGESELQFQIRSETICSLLRTEFTQTISDCNQSREIFERPKPFLIEDQGIGIKHNFQLTL